MKSRLVPCSGCARHVRITEGVCPFCGTAAPRSLEEVLHSEPPPPGLSRAVRYGYRRFRLAKAVAGAALLATGACDSAPVAAYGGPPPTLPVQAPSPPDASGVADAANAPVSAAYGAPPPTLSAPTPSPPSPSNQVAVPAYGAPPPSPPPVSPRKP